MRSVYFFIKIFTLYLLFISNLFAITSNSFKEGKALFDKKKFEKSKVFFERDIVFNPKNATSYLFLAKIYKKAENDEEEAKKLNNVILLEPQNDEAIYLLTLLKIKQSNYDKASELINKFDLVCQSFCSKKKELKQKFEKLIPTDEKN